MDGQRAERVGDLLMKLLLELLREEVRDPRIAGVVLTGVKLSKDLRHACVYFNLLERSQNLKDVLAGLKSATGFIRTKVARQLQLRFVPTIEFSYDETQEEAQRIDELLKQVKS